MPLIGQQVLLHDDIKTYLSKWNLKPLGDAQITGCSNRLMRVHYESKPAMLKLFRAESDEQRSACVLNYWSGQGAVRVLKCDDYALLMENAEDNISLKRLVEEGRDEETTTILAEGIAVLHAQRGTAPALPALSQRFEILFAHGAQDSFFHQAAVMAKALLNDTENDIILHGDMHHGNLLSSVRGWLAIDPKGFIGDPAYDAANVLCNPSLLASIVHDAQRMRRSADILSERLGYGVVRLLRYAYVHAAMAVLWTREDGGEPSYWLGYMETAARALERR